MKKIVYYDVDETLFTHDPEHAPAILLVDSSGTRRLSTTEFHSAKKLEDGQRFDFSEFRCAKRFTMSARPVKPMINRMINDWFKGEIVEMLTARGDMDDKELVNQFFKKHLINIDHIHLHRAGNHGHDSPSKNKYIHISETIKNRGFEHVVMYDDNHKMLDVMRQLTLEFNVTTEFHHVIPPHSLALFNTYKFYNGEQIYDRLEIGSF